MSNSVIIAVLGLGEEAGMIAGALASAGADVVGFDTAKIKRPPVPMAESAVAAVADADLVLSLNSSSVAARTAESVAAALKPGAVYADLNAGTPALKRKLAGLLPAGAFVDVALLKPVTDPVTKTEPQIECEAAGEAAGRLQQLLAPLGVSVTVVSATPGDAAARNLISSLFAKGTAAVIADTLWAAKSMGLEGWAIDAIKDQFDAGSAQTVQDYLDDTGKNPKRHSVAMTDVVEMLSESNYDSTLVNGIGLTFSHIMHGRKIPYADLSDD